MRPIIEKVHMNIQSNVGRDILVERMNTNEFV